MFFSLKNYNFVYKNVCTQVRDTLTEETEEQECRVLTVEADVDLPGEGDRGVGVGRLAHELAAQVLSLQHHSSHHKGTAKDIKKAIC